jgi:hypothetical protein
MLPGLDLREDLTPLRFFEDILNYCVGASSVDLGKNGRWSE